MEWMVLGYDKWHECIGPLCSICEINTKLKPASPFTRPIILFLIQLVRSDLIPPPQCPLRPSLHKRLFIWVSDAESPHISGLYPMYISHRIIVWLEVKCPTLPQAQKGRVSSTVYRGQLSDLCRSTLHARYHTRRMYSGVPARTAKSSSTPA